MPFYCRNLCNWIIRLRCLSTFCRTQRRWGRDLDHSRKFADFMGGHRVDSSRDGTSTWWKFCAWRVYHPGYRRTHSKNTHFFSVPGKIHGRINVRRLSALSRHFLLADNASIQPKKIKKDQSLFTFLIIISAIALLLATWLPIRRSPKRAKKVI